MQREASYAYNELLYGWAIDFNQDWPYTLVRLPKTPYREKEHLTSDQNYTFSTLVTITVKVTGQRRECMSSVESLKIRAKLLQKSKRKSGKVIALKEAFGIIAKSQGYKSWKDLKDDYEISDLLNPPRWSSQWKQWFTDKTDAQRFLNSKTYLIPYRDQYFICDDDYLKALGIDVTDEDLKLVGNDFTSPQNARAWIRLISKIQKHHSTVG